MLISALEIDEAAARIAGINGRIGLYEVFVTLLADPSSAKCADKTRCVGVHDHSGPGGADLALDLFW
jgi:hypothetical protein